MTNPEGNGRGPSWRWIVGVLASLLLVLLGAVVGSFAGRLTTAEMDLRAQTERSSRQDTRIELQSYRIAADSTLIMEFRTEMRAGIDELKQLVKRPR